VKIKICGITNLKDARAAIEAGADLLGFNFYPKSPRYLEASTCREITSVLRKDFPGITLVGVFVNASVTEINTTLGTCGLALAQLHGDEPPEMLMALGGRAFKAVRLKADSGADCEAEKRMAEFARSREGSVPALLVDAAVKGVYGGSGAVADWSAAADLSKWIPLLLAGGLTPENVSAAVRQVKPWGVDVASGVEASPGVKDAKKMAAFVAAVRAVNSAGAEIPIILPAEIDDLDEILALQKLAYQSEAQLNNDFTIPPLTQTLDEIRAEFGQAVFLKALQDGKMIGSVRGRLDGDTCHIGRVIVHPEYQNKGIGSRLLREIERRVNARRFELFTSQRSERNLYLYRKFGYRDFKQVPLNERVTLIFLEKLNDKTTA
jgi:phosphoribosylanthranilate isomerase